MSDNAVRILRIMMPFMFAPIFAFGMLRWIPVYGVEPMLQFAVLCISGFGAFSLMLARLGFMRAYGLWFLPICLIPIPLIVANRLGYSIGSTLILLGIAVTAVIQFFIGLWLWARMAFPETFGAKS